MTAIISQNVYEKTGGTTLGTSYVKGLNTSKIIGINPALSYPTTNDIKAEVIYVDGVRKKYYVQDTVAAMAAKT